MSGQAMCFSGSESKYSPGRIIQLLTLATILLIAMMMFTPADFLSLSKTPSKAYATPNDYLENDTAIPTESIEPFATITYTGSWEDLQHFIQNQTSVGDTVVIDNRVFGAAYSTVVVTKNITITSTNPLEPIYMQNPAVRHFDTDQNTPVTLTLQNITLDGLGSGGGVNCAAANDTLILGRGATIQNCSAGEMADGGAIISRGRTLLQSGSLIANNMATRGVGSGGGIFQHEGASLTIEDGAILSNNRASQNGGAICAGSTLGVNTAVDKTSPVIMNGGLITGNRASLGGGIFTQSTLTLNGGTIEKNAAEYMGGGIYATHAEPVDLRVNMTGGTIDNNTARWGGGIALWKSLLMIGPSGRMQASNGESIGVDIAPVTPMATTAHVSVLGGTISNNMASGSGTEGPNATIVGNEDAKGPGGSGGGIYTYRYEFLTVEPNAVFTNNLALLPVPQRNPAHNAVYTSNVAGTQWSFPFTQGYNNYDINHIHTKTIEVTYVDEAGNTIADPEVLSGYVSDYYASSKKNVSGYELKEVRGDASGRFYATPQSVVYVYASTASPASHQQSPSSTPQQPMSAMQASQSDSVSPKTALPKTGDEVIPLTGLFSIIGLLGITLLLISRKPKLGG